MTLLFVALQMSFVRYKLSNAIMTKTENRFAATSAKKQPAIKKYLMKKATLISWPFTIRSRIRGIYFRGNPYVTFQAKSQ